MSQAHWTAFAVSGRPVCAPKPSRNRKLSSVPSSFHDQLVARSGAMDFNVFCGTCWSKMTRLLNTAIIGATVEIVTSSSVDMLAGVSRWEIWRTPPGFCADAVSALSHTTSSPGRNRKRSKVALRWRLRQYGRCDNPEKAASFSCDVLTNHFRVPNVLLRRPEQQMIALRMGNP